MASRPTRRRVVLAALAAVAGCTGPGGESATEGGGGTDGGGGDGGDDTGTPANPARGDADQQGDLHLSSPAFDDGGEIPRKYGGREANVNPPLRIQHVPTTAGSLALVMDDPDAKPVAGKVWIHWLVWNITPDRTTIPEDWTPDDAIEGTNSGGNVDYGGPAPPDDRHTYRFKLFALDATLDLASGASVDQLGRAMDGHVLASTQLTGTYAP